MVRGFTRRSEVDSFARSIFQFSPEAGRHEEMRPAPENANVRDVGGGTVPDVERRLSSIGAMRQAVVDNGRRAQRLSPEAVVEVRVM